MGRIIDTQLGFQHYIGRCLLKSVPAPPFRINLYHYEEVHLMAGLLAMPMLSLSRPILKSALSPRSIIQSPYTPIFLQKGGWANQQRHCQETMKPSTTAPKHINVLSVFISLPQVHDVVMESHVAAEVAADACRGAAHAALEGALSTMRTEVDEVEVRGGAKGRHWATYGSN